MIVRITNITLQGQAEASNTLLMAWRLQSSPDIASSYTALPNLVVNAQGTPAAPYSFTVPDSSVVVQVTSSCGNSIVKKVVPFTGCTLVDFTCSIFASCPPGAIEVGTGCKLTEVTPATITASNVCVAPSNNVAYSSEGTKIYNATVTPTDIAATAPFIINSPTTPSSLEALILTAPLWRGTQGPMPRNSVWLDTNCDGVKNSLTLGEILTFSKVFNSPTAKTMYIGFGADNKVRIKLNNSVVMDATGIVNSSVFIYWHVMPVQVQQGTNILNVEAIGDGSADDACAVVLYDADYNTLISATSESQLNILFSTKDFLPTAYPVVDAEKLNVASCPLSYDMVVDGNTYTCKRITFPAKSFQPKVRVNFNSSFTAADYQIELRRVSTPTVIESTTTVNFPYPQFLDIAVAARVPYEVIIRRTGCPGELGKKITNG